LETNLPATTSLNKLFTGLRRYIVSIILYIFRAVALLRCVWSVSFRTETFTRWKKTPTHLVIYEIGGGFMGLIVLVALVWLIVVNLG
jgi:hypothetical protein